jgi:hypothetical protein
VTIQAAARQLTATIRRPLVVLAGVSMALAVTMLASRFDPLPAGLTAEYFTGAGADAQSVRVRSGRLPDAADVESAWPRGIPAPVKVEWRGSVVLSRAGAYTFDEMGTATLAIFVDGRDVFSRSAAGEVSTVGALPLASGAHALLVQYLHTQGPVALDLGLRRDNDRRRPLAEARLSGPAPSRSLVLASVAIAQVAAVIQWTWIVSLLIAAAWLAASGTRRLVRSLDREGLWQTLRWILLGSFVLNATALWWGLPGHWAPDELTPGTVFEALGQHFSHGWWDRYPPLHYYVLTLAMGPALLLDAWGRIDAYSTPWPTVLDVVGRSVSLVGALGIVIAIAIAGARTFGRRAGLLAAIVFSLATTFLYYAKTANLDVPYLFWFALSLVCYLRAIDRRAVRDFALVGLFGALSIATKDQAYGLYFGMAIVLLVVVARERAGAARWKAIVDRRLLIGAGVAAATFVLAHNLAFNWSGFVEHVRFITGPGNENYRAFPPTTEGRLALAYLTARLIKITWGWPITIFAIAGLVVALRRRERWWITLALLAPAASYYATFIHVILYNYDRFVLPICLVLSLFAGLAIDRLLAVGRTRSQRRLAAGVAGAAFAYTLLYAAMVDALMLRDSRFAVEAWLREHARDGDRVGLSGPSEQLPRVPLGTVRIETMAELDAHRPALYVLNADYARAVPADTEWGRLIAALQRGEAGYELAIRVRTPSPWPWLPDAHPDLVGQRAAPAEGAPPFDVARYGFFVILRNVAPEIVVFRRTGAAGTGR